MSGKIQNEDIKSSAEINAAGGTDAQLPNDSKVYVTGNSLNKLLSVAIADGDLVRGVRAINAQTGLTYSFVLTDGSKNANNPLTTATNAATQTYTVPANASVAFPVGTQIDLVQMGAGKVTFSPDVGVSIVSKSGQLSTNGQGVGVTLIKLATDTWVLLGDLTT